MISSPEHIAMILAGTKTQTRRMSSNYKVGHTYALQPGRGKHGIGQRIKIVDIHKERLGNIDLESARAEGHQTIEEYKEVWKRINNK